MPVIGRIERKTRKTDLSLETPSLPELIRQAVKKDATRAKAIALKHLLLQPIDERTNREYCLLVKDIIDRLGISDTEPCQRSITMACQYGGKHGKPEGDYWYSVLGQCVCQVCVPKGKWPFIEPLEVDRL